MSRIAYVDGRYVPQRTASVSAQDRGYQLADGVYEAIHRYRDRVRDPELHLGRLERSLRELRIPQPMSRTALLAVMDEVARRNRVTDGLYYIQVTRGVAPRGHAFPKVVRPVLVVMIRRVPPFPATPDEWAVKVVTHPDQRWARCDIKSVALLPNVLARQAAAEQGAFEAVLVDGAGMVTEGAASSFWIVDEAGAIRLPHLGEHILPGCTRAALLAELEHEGVKVDVRAFSVDEARRAREAFLTSVNSFVRPVVAIDGAPVADGKVGPVTRRLFEIFARHVKGELRNAA